MGREPREPGRWLATGTLVAVPEKIGRVRELEQLAGGDRRSGR